MDDFFTHLSGELGEPEDHHIREGLGLCRVAPAIPVDRVPALNHVAIFEFDETVNGHI